MNPRHKVVLTAGLAAVTLMLILWGWTRSPTQPEARAMSEQQPLATPSRPTSVTASNASQLAASLSDSFRKELQESHPDLPGLDSLQPDIEAVYQAWLRADISVFSDLMRTKDASLGPKTEAIVESRRSSYADLTDDEWAAMGTEQQLAYIWEHPGERDASWHRVAMREARTGTGWHGAEEDLAKSTAGRYSVFEFEGRKHIFGEAMRGERPTVWMVLPVEFNDGVWLETRLTWVWLDDTRGWYPARVETLGNGSRSCLMF